MSGDDDLDLDLGEALELLGQPLSDESPLWRIFRVANYGRKLDLSEADLVLLIFASFSDLREPLLMRFVDRSVQGLDGEDLYNALVEAHETFEEAKAALRLEALAKLSSSGFETSGILELHNFLFVRSRPQDWIQP